jgi:hypothetical protein
METDPNILYQREFETSRNRLASVEVRHHSIDAGLHHFESVDLAVSAVIFGNLDQAEEYANSILDAVVVARNKRSEVGIGVDGKPLSEQRETVIPLPAFKKKLSRIQLKVLHQLSGEGVILEYQSHREKGLYKREKVIIHLGKYSTHRIDPRTFAALRDEKFIQKMGGHKGIGGSRGHTTYWVISTSGRDYVAQYPEEIEDAE